MTASTYGAINIHAPRFRRKILQHLFQKYRLMTGLPCLHIYSKLKKECHFPLHQVYSDSHARLRDPIFQNDRVRLPPSPRFQDVRRRATWRESPGGLAHPVQPRSRLDKCAARNRAVPRWLSPPLTPPTSPHNSIPLHSVMGKECYPPKFSRRSG